MCPSSFMVKVPRNDLHTIPCINLVNPKYVGFSFFGVRLGGFLLFKMNVFGFGTFSLTKQAI